MPRTRFTSWRSVPPIASALTNSKISSGSDIFVLPDRDERSCQAGRVVEVKVVRDRMKEAGYHESDQSQLHARGHAVQLARRRQARALAYHTMDAANACKQHTQKQ